MVLTVLRKSLMPSNLWNFRIGGVLKSEVNNKWISTERVKTILRIEF